MTINALVAQFKHMVNFISALALDEDDLRTLNRMEREGLRQLVFRLIVLLQQLEAKLK